MTRPSRPRKSKPPIREAGSFRKSPRTSLPEELAHDAVAHEKAAPGDRVEMVFRLRFSKVVAEALTARAVREEKNLTALVAEILEAVVRKA